MARPRGTLTARRGKPVGRSEATIRPYQRRCGRMATLTLVQDMKTSIAPAGDRDRWQAVLSRDRKADGRFVYAVSSTGVFCRPSCPSRRPKREYVAFFASPQEDRKST